MKIKIYNTVQEFLNENEKLLLENESVTQLILHNAFVNRDKVINKEVMFGRIEDEKGAAKLIFANVKPYNLLIYNLDNNTLESVNELANYLIQDDVDLKGINANKKICDEFTEYYGYKKGCTFKKYLSMDVMEITKVNEGVNLPKGNFRVATLKDKELLIDWYIKFTKEALNEEVSYLDFEDKLLKRIESQNIYIFEDEKNRAMAMISVTRQLVNGVSVSYVYSSKEARGKGFGLAVVYYLSKEYLDKGNRFCTLFVDKKNPISNAVYKKIGYRILDDNYDYRIV